MCTQNCFNQLKKRIIAFIVKLSSHATGYMEYTQFQAPQYLLLAFHLKKSCAFSYSQAPALCRTGIAVTGSEGRIAAWGLGAQQITGWRQARDKISRSSKSCKGKASNLYSNELLDSALTAIYISYVLISKKLPPFVTPLAELYSWFFLLHYAYLCPSVVLFMETLPGTRAHAPVPLCTPCSHSSSADAGAPDPAPGYSCVSFPIVNAPPDLPCSKHHWDPNTPPKQPTSNLHLHIIKISRKAGMVLLFCIYYWHKN